ncbi:Protein SERAC1 [Penicillium subrubescens]|uniref:Protein SERAC1 n=1 Tax=Penicillium subrubescens TaxID=1316194 RepID=A0A1Q5U3V6_9EURO|nr:Protein SERAC1 [Penicillium subrubescens]
MLRQFMPRRRAAPKSKKFGMFIFADQEPDTAAVVDIVAIHGLNGHYFQTWATPVSDGREVNWLKDLLPKQIPNARIMSFGYNSAVQMSKSAGDISLFADQLLEDLFIRRQRQEEPGRPIIFICHSLGGIVFKQTLNRAFEKARYRPLLQKVVGVIFFGTPHQGSDLASWGTVLSNIIRFGTLGTTTNSRLSRDLESNSRILASISKSFVERGKDLEIYSFYETDMMKRLNCRVSAGQCWLSFYKVLRF